MEDPVPCFCRERAGDHAICSASMTRLLRASQVASTSPTTRRLNRSITTARKQPALMSWDVGDVSDPRLVGRSHGEVAIQQVGRNRQTVSDYRS